MVAGLVVEQHGERVRTRRGDAVAEGGEDGGAVLDGRDLGADEGAGVGVDEQLDVDRVRAAVDHGVEQRAVADPLGAREEGLELVAQRDLVGTAALSSRGDAGAVQQEDVGEDRAVERDAEVRPNVVAEGRERALPAAVRVEDGLDLGPGGAPCGGEGWGRSPRSQSRSVSSGTRISSAIEESG